MDFGRRLIAKFRFDPADFWDETFPCIDKGALLPDEATDPLLRLTEEVKAALPAP